MVRKNMNDKNPMNQQPGKDLAENFRSAIPQMLWMEEFSDVGSSMQSIKDLKLAN